MTTMMLECCKIQYIHKVSRSFVTSHPLRQGPKKSQVLQIAADRNPIAADRTGHARESETHGCQNADFSPVNCFNHLAEQKKLRLLIAIAADRSRSRDQLIAADRNRSRSRDFWHLRRVFFAVLNMFL